MDDLWSGQASKTRWLRAPGQTHLHFFFDQEWFIFVEHFLKPFLENKLQQGLDYYIWLSALIRYKQIADEADVTDRWSAYRSVTSNLCSPVCPSVGPYVLLSFLSSNRHWMSSWLYTRREISELIRQMISQFSEDTYSDVHEMVRKIRLFSSLFLVFNFTRISISNLGWRWLGVGLRPNYIHGLPDLSRFTAKLRPLRRADGTNDISSLITKSF